MHIHGYWFIQATEKEQNSRIIELEQQLSVAGKTEAASTDAVAEAVSAAQKVQLHLLFMLCASGRCPSRAISPSLRAFGLGVLIRSPYSLYACLPSAAQDFTAQREKKNNELEGWKQKAESSAKLVKRLQVRCCSIASTLLPLDWVPSAATAASSRGDQWAPPSRVLAVLGMREFLWWRWLTTYG